MHKILPALISSSFLVYKITKPFWIKYALFFFLKQASITKKTVKIADNITFIELI